jgi:hypothetical protein
MAVKERRRAPYIKLKDFNLIPEGRKKYVVRDAGAIGYGLEAPEQMTDSAAVSVAEDPLRLSRQLFQ